MSRNDTLKISLGPDKVDHTIALKRLARVLDMHGRKGDGSISSLMITIAKAYDKDAAGTITAMRDIMTMALED